MEQLDQLGFPPVYGGRPMGHLQNTPLWSRAYTYCTQDKDCGVNAGGSGPFCLSVDQNLKCAPGDTCICTNAVLASRLHRARR